MIRLVQPLLVFAVFLGVQTIQVGPALERIPAFHTVLSLHPQDMAIYPTSKTDICILTKRHQIGALQILAEQSWVLSSTQCTRSFRPITPHDMQTISQNDALSGEIIATAPAWNWVDFVSEHLFWFFLAVLSVVLPIRRIPRIDDVNRTLFRQLKVKDRIIMLSLLYLAKSQSRLNQNQINLIIEAGQAYGLKKFDHAAFGKAYDALPPVSTLEPILQLTKHAGTATREAILHAAVQFFIASGRPTILERKQYGMLVRILRCDTQRAVGEFHDEARRLSLG